MPYAPRPATTAQCAHCGTSFEKKHASRKYCSNSCNVQASYARTGYRAEGRPSRADLEQALARMTQLVELVTGKPAPAAKAAATEPKKKITAPAPRKPAAKAAATKPAKKAVSTSKKKITAPAPAAKAAATKSEEELARLAFENDPKEIAARRMMEEDQEQARRWRIAVDRRLG